MYTEAKKKARYKSNKPTMTDQSQAKDTDLNIIVRTLAATGKVAGNPGQAMIGADFTDAPTDLRGHLEAARAIQGLRNSLPKELQQLTMQQLYDLDNKQLAEYYAKAKPKDKPTDKPKEEPPK